MIVKSIYRYSKWFLLYICSLGQSNKIMYVNPKEIKYGQLPKHQFHKINTYKFKRGGDWDRMTLPVKDHVLYQSFVKHFLEGVSWDETQIYKNAVKIIENGGNFRSHYDSTHSLKDRFDKCDLLYTQIKKEGYKSNHELYKEKKIDNILWCLDEITVNISRDGKLLLNDGWHRLITAQLLNLPTIPVRILVRHAYSKR